MGVPGFVAPGFGAIRAFLDRDFAEVVHLRRLAKIEIPVQIFGNRDGLKGAVVGAGGQAHDHVLKLADAAVADQFASEAEIAIAALLTADLQNALVLAHGFHEAFALVNAERQRFFRIDILAGLDREQVHHGMPMVGRAGDNDVNVVALHEFAEVIIDHGHFLPGRELFRRRGSLSLVHVADGDDFAKPAGAIAVAATLPAAADEGNAGLVIRTERLRGGRLREILFQKPTRHARGGTEGGGGLEETTTINLKRFGIHFC